MSHKTTPQAEGIVLPVQPPIENLLGERWLPVAGLERFHSVSTEARLWSWWAGRLLTPYAITRNRPDGRKYSSVQVSMRDKRLPLATLVLETFVGPRPAGTYVHFRNSDHMDCRLVNLAWRPRADLQKEISTRRPPRTHCTRCGHELTELGDERRCLICKPLRSVMAWDET